MRIVIALGGNALLQRGQKPDASEQIANVDIAVDALAPVAKEHELVVTHGNGPQVGVIALQSANDPHLSEPYPFDTLGAMTQGMIGYWLQHAFKNALPDREVVCTVNQTLVDANDPALDNPTKFVGEVYNEEEAKELEAERGWVMKADGKYFRRVVGSPIPQSIVEINTVKNLVENGTTVICSGGGGIPVIKEDGKYKGLEAVIDKDRSGAVLSEDLKADIFMILTDVPAVLDNYGTQDECEINRATPEELRKKGFADGSMGPKVEAACQFVERTGGVAAIGRLADAQQIIAGTAGTIITSDGQYDPK